jgi:hypothetical protein
MVGRDRFTYTKKYSGISSAPIVDELTDHITPNEEEFACVVIETH